MAKKSRTTKPARNWLLAAARWLWWPIALLFVLVFVAGLINILQRSPEDALEFLFNSAYAMPNFSEIGMTAQQFLLLYLLPGVLVAAVFVAVGLLVRLSRAESWFGLFASLWMVAFGLVDTPIFNEAAISDSRLLPVFYIALLFGYVGAIVFLLIYPDGKFHPPWTRYLVLGWGLFALSTTFGDWFEWTPAQSALVIVPLMLFMLYSQVYRYRNVSTPTQKEQTKWLIVAIALLAIALVISGIAAGVVAGAETTGEAVTYILVSVAAFSFGDLMVVLAVGVAILRYRLWDIEVVVNRSLIYGPLSLILAGVFAVSVALVNQVARELGGTESATTAAIASALVVTIVFQPLKNAIEKWINRRIYPDNLQLSRDFVEIGPEAGGVLKPSQIGRITAERLPKLLNSKHAAVFVGDGKRAWQRVAANGANASAPRVSDKGRSDLEKGKVLVKEDGMSLLVPLFVPRLRSKDLVGMVEVGPRKNGRGYSADDRRALGELGGEIGTALYLAQLRQKGS
jgi:hypothetical protein